MSGCRPGTWTLHAGVALFSDHRNLAYTSFLPCGLLNYQISRRSGCCTGTLFFGSSATSQFTVWERRTTGVISCQRGGNSRDGAGLGPVPQHAIAIFTYAESDYTLPSKTPSKQANWRQGRRWRWETRP